MSGRDPTSTGPDNSPGVKSAVDSSSGEPGASQRLDETGGGSFALDVGKLASGATIAQILAVVASPLLTRLYAPDAFGTSTLFVAPVGIVGVVACLRYDLAVMLPEDDREAAHLVWASIGSTMAAAALTALIMVGGGSTISAWLNAPTLASYLWLAPISVLFAGIFSTLNYWNSRTRKYGRLSVARVSASGVTIGTQLGGGYAGQNGGGMLILGHVAGSAVSTSVLAGQIWRDDRVLLREGLDVRAIRAGMKRYRKFPLVSIWSALMNSVSWQLPAFLLAGFFSTSVTGFYSLSFRVLAMPMHVVGSAIAQVFFQRAARAKSYGGLPELVESTYRRLVTYGLLPFVVLGIVGEDLFAVVFGSSWAEAGVYAQILSPWIFFWFVSSPMSTLFEVLEKQEVSLAANVTLLGTRFGSLLLGGLTGNVMLGLAVFSGTGVLVYGGVTMLILRYAGVGLKKGLRALAIAVAWSIPAGAAPVVLGATGVAPTIQLGVAILVCLVLYSLMANRDPVAKNVAAQAIIRLFRRRDPA